MPWQPGAYHLCEWKAFKYLCKKEDLPGCVRFANNEFEEDLGTKRNAGTRDGIFTQKSKEEKNDGHRLLILYRPCIFLFLWTRLFACERDLEVCS